jgi:hypothetical protein
VEQLDLHSAFITIATSDPIGTDPRAGREALGDRRQGIGGALQHASQPIEGEAVDNLLTPTLTGNEAAVPQASKVRADTGLRLTDHRHQLSNGALLNCEELKDLQPGGISENSEKTGGRRWVNPGKNVGIHIRLTGYQIEW